MNQLTVALIVVIGLLGGFYGGLKYGQNNPPRSANSTAANATLAGAAANGGGAGGRGTTGGAGARGAGGGGGGFGGAVTGQITAVGNGTITLHETTGQDVQVNVSAARITQTSQGTTADLTPNTQVTVTGPTGSDGTVNATLVAIGGLGALGGGGFGRGQQAATPSPGG